ncbi:UDP-glucose 4-epimerase GalE [Niveispirillum fermenti]|uniref:UDP-glucose 4-epimerase GalE n=1 Tax=Niveispirillum fermenti TaxID=1233113 RepID=UPI003A836BAE
MNAKSFLVTGGAGYVGSHAVDALLRAGHHVTVIDDLSQGHRGAVPAVAELLVGDAGDRALLARVLAARPFHAVMHFAARSLVGESMQKPHLYLRDNVQTAHNLIEETVAAGVRRFVLSSTANIFASPPDGAALGEEAPIAPGSPYGEGKHMVERLLHWADRCHGLRSAALRYFNAAGAHPDGHIGEDHHPETHLIPIVLEVALGKRSHLDIYGDDYPTPDGTCIRDYVHVCDIADAHLRVLDVLDDRSVRYNVGSGSGYSVRQVVEAAEKVIGRPIPVRMAPRRPGDPAVLVADGNRLRAETGWSPALPGLEDIIATAWAWRSRHPDGFGG